MEADAPLRGLRVLVVEDESVVAMLIEDMLIAMGADVEVAMRLAEAQRYASDFHFDLAILDVNLGHGARSDAVADALHARGIPFVFSTGYGESGLTERHRGTPTVQKPYRPTDLHTAITRAMDLPASG